MYYKAPFFPWTEETEATVNNRDRSTSLMQMYEYRIVGIVYRREYQTKTSEGFYCSYCLEFCACYCLDRVTPEQSDN